MNQQNSLFLINKHKYNIGKIYFLSMSHLSNQNLYKKQVESFSNTFKINKKSINSRYLHQNVKQINRCRLNIISEHQRNIQKSLSLYSNQNFDGHKHNQQNQFIKKKKKAGIIIKILKEVQQNLSRTKNKSIHNMADNLNFLSKNSIYCQKISKIQFYKQKKQHLNQLIALISQERIKKDEFQPIKNRSQRQENLVKQKRSVSLKKLDNIQVKIQRSAYIKKKQQITSNQLILRIYLVQIMLSELFILCYISQFFKKLQDRSKICLALQTQFFKYKQTNKNFLELIKNQKSHSLFNNHKKKQKPENLIKMINFKNHLLQYLILEKCLKIQKHASGLKSSSTYHFQRYQNQKNDKKQEENLSDKDKSQSIQIQEQEQEQEDVLASKQQPKKMQFSAKRVNILSKKIIKLLHQIIYQQEIQPQTTKNEMFSTLQSKDQNQFTKQQIEQFKKLYFKINIQVMHEMATILGTVSEAKNIFIKQKKKFQKQADEDKKFKQLKTIYNLDKQENFYRKSASTLNSTSFSMNLSNVNNKNMGIIQKIYEVLYQTSLKMLGQNEILTITMKNIWQNKVSLKNILKGQNNKRQFKTFSNTIQGQKKKEQQHRHKTQIQQANPLDISDFLRKGIEQHFKMKPITQIKVDYFNRLKLRQQKQSKIGKIIKQKLTIKQQKVKPKIKQKQISKFNKKEKNVQKNKQLIKEKEKESIQKPKKQIFKVQQPFFVNQLNIDRYSQIKQQKRQAHSSFSIQELTAKLNIKKNQNLQQVKKKEESLILNHLNNSRFKNSRSQLSKSFNSSFQNKQQYYQRQLKLLLQAKKKKRLEEKERQKMQKQECKLI